LKTQVFIRTYIKHPIRAYLAGACIERWRMQEDADVTLLLAMESMVPTPSIQQVIIYEPDFWRAAKQKAEDLATGPVYVLADDDQLICGENWIREGLRILEDHPQYGFISARSFCEEVPDYHHGDEDVFPINCAGAPYFMRKGVIGAFPESEISRQDIVLSEIFKERGLQMGMCRKLRFNHLGKCYSTEQSDLWWNHP